MGYHDDGVALRMDVAKLFHDDVTGATVEVAGWLISENDRRLSDERTSDCDALLLATRELVRHVVFALMQVKMFENVVCLLETAGLWNAVVDEWQGNVFNDGKGRDEVEILEDETNFLCAEMSFFASGNFADIFAMK